MSGVNYSRFPAAISSDRRAERRAAVVVRDGHATIAIATGQGVQTVEEFDVTAARTEGRTTILEGTDGTIWTVSKGDGCGCASPLRTWYNKSLGTPKRSGRG